jgi:hypothetical protein
MKNGSLSNWLKAVEQEIIELAERISAKSAKLQLIAHDLSSPSSLGNLGNALRKDILNLRELAHRVNLKSIQLARTEADNPG